MENRNKNIFQQIKWSFVFKALAFIVYYISISYQIKILGAELYGVWATLLSIVTWVVFFDFGLGNGIKNYLTKALAKNNIEEAKEIIMTGYIAIAIISIALFLLVFFLASTVDLKALFNTELLSNQQLKYIVITLFGFVFLHFIISFVKQFIFAIQKNALNEFEQLLFYSLLMGALYFIYVQQYKSIFSIVIAYGLALIIGKSILTLIFFSKNRHLLPSFKNFKKKIMGKLMNVGMTFFALQLVYIFILLSDKMIITQLLGPSEVTSYDIVYRVMSVILVFHGVVNAPMWSAYTEAYNKHDTQWIKNNLKKMNYFIIILIFIAGILSFFYKEIIELWIGEELHIEPSLVYAMAVYVIVVSWNNNHAFFVNSINKIKWQLYAYSVGAVINIPLSIYFARSMNLGSLGVVLATIISLFIFSIVGFIQTRMILSNSYAENK